MNVLAFFTAGQLGPSLGAAGEEVGDGPEVELVRNVQPERHEHSLSLSTKSGFYVETIICIHNCVVNRIELSVRVFAQLEIRTQMPRTYV